MKSYKPYAQALMRNMVPSTNEQKYNAMKKHNAYEQNVLQFIERDAMKII